ncbi:MAG: alpha-amylase family protein [Spirochaetota bacterium]
MITLGTQYYRAPFPNEKHWEDDIRLMKDAGLNTVQLWVLWGWVEATPDTFRFDDYDRLVSIAEKNGMGVVLSTIAEIHPYWIHDVIPGSEMITSMGNKVVSSNRGECHFGLTPGGCFDHPGVMKRMSAFISAVAERYSKAPNIRGWDAWNELRWNVQADGLVCYCEHTLRAYRAWLMKRYGSLDELNRVWQRRYHRLEEILPGKVSGRPYTEMMTFEHFFTERANEHAKTRYDIIKKIDPKRPVTVHGGAPSTHYAGDINAHVMTLDRGNDWSFADHTDGVGFSSFPKWGNIDNAAFAARVRYVASAAEQKKKSVWLSELQGGRSNIGFIEPTPSVDARSQQRWVWNGIAGGANTVLFWCWRDEVFGCESNGFGIIGTDGKREERVAALQRTGKILTAHEKLLDGYRPATPEVGVFFSPQTYYLNWAQEGKAGKSRDALDRYSTALVRENIPYSIIEEEHLDALSGITILFMPRTFTVDDTVAEKLLAFVKNGGTLVTESECGAFDHAGVYRYPEERFLARSLGIREIGRRKPEGPISMRAGNSSFTFEPELWITPFADVGTVLAKGSEGALAVSVAHGTGQVIALGTFLGSEKNIGMLGGLINAMTIAAGVAPAVSVKSPLPKGTEYVQVHYGMSGGKRIMFIFFPEGISKATLSFTGDFAKAGTFTDLMGGASYKASANKIDIATNDIGIVVVAEG